MPFDVDAFATSTVCCDLDLSVADLGIDGRGAPSEVWALSRIEGLGLLPSGSARGRAPARGLGAKPPRR